MVDDFKKLVAEAVRDGYQPRALKCWPWQHAWTMWTMGRHPTYPTLEAAQTRRCVRCGKSQIVTVKHR